MIFKQVEQKINQIEQIVFLCITFPVGRFRNLHLDGKLSDESV